MSGRTQIALAWAALVTAAGCGGDGPPGSRNAPQDGSGESGPEPARGDGGSEVGGTSDASLPAPALCLEAGDGGTVLAVQAVELVGKILLSGLAAPPVSATVTLQGTAGTFTAAIDKAGAFRALVAPGSYDVTWRATVVLVDSGSTYFLAATIGKGIDVRGARVDLDGLPIVLAPLSGTLTWNGRTNPWARPDGDRCYGLSLDEVRTDGAPASRLSTTAHCDGTFSVPIVSSLPASLPGLATLPGRYRVSVNGPAPGEEDKLPLAAGVLASTEIDGATPARIDVPLSQASGTVAAPFALGCKNGQSRIDFRRVTDNAVVSLRLCDDRLDGSVPPGRYAPTLITELGGGAMRFPLPGPVDLGANRTDLSFSVDPVDLAGEVRVNGMLAKNLSNAGTATVQFSGKGGGAFTAWILPGRPMLFAGKVPMDVFDVAINAAGLLPGVRFPVASPVDTSQGAAPPTLIFDIPIVDIGGRITFGGSDPSTNACAPHDVLFEPSEPGRASITATAACRNGLLAWTQPLHPGHYRVSVRRPNGQRVMVLANLDVTQGIAPVVVDVPVLPERATGGQLLWNGCRSHEPGGACAATYVVTLFDPTSGFTYRSAAAYTDEPYSLVAAPGRYTATVTVTPLCGSSPFAAVAGPFELATPVVVE